MRLLARRSGTFNINAERAGRILSLLHTDASAGEIEAEVLMSPTLAINLVKLASSAAYGAMEISSVKFAIELLGWKELESLMATLLMTSMEQDVRDGIVIDAQRLRQRSLVQAFVARSLAKKHAPKDADDLYTAGLFCDAGYLMLAIHHPLLLLNLKKTCERTNGLSLLEAEDAVFGFTHAELSAVMAEEFRLSPLVIACLRAHHTPIEASAELQAAADICSVASGLADAIGLDPIDGLPRMGYDPLACRRLGIDENALATTAEALTSKAFAVADTIGTMARAA